MDEKLLYAFGGVAAGALAGAAATYLVMMKRLEKTFTEQLQIAVEAEVAATKKFYTIVQKDAYPTPGDLLAEVAEKDPSFVLDIEKVEEVRNLIEASEYGDTQGAVPEARNVFATYADNSTWDQEAEETQRDPNKPYIISAEEFFENAPDYIQTQLNWFEEDGVLADTSDKPADEFIVGEDNLEKFGHGSKDPNIVYIRNDAMDMDFEVSRSEGRYAEQVHGIMQHGEPQGRRAIRKFRPTDE